MKTAPSSYFDPKNYSLKPKLTFSLHLLTDPASMQTVRQKKTASSSEPKLFKTNVFSRQKAMRHTFRFSKQDSGTDKFRFKKVWFQKETWFKVENILKGSLDLILSPWPSVKIQIMGRKVCFRFIGKKLQVNKLLKTKSLLTKPSNVLPHYLK